MKEFLPALDVLFKPYTNVSGDFYAFSRFSEAKAYLVIGDCTGHGVAGAFLSNICMATLNSFFDQNVDHTPKQILFEVLQQIRKLSEKAERVMSSMISVELSVLSIDRSRKVIAAATNSKQIMFFKENEIHVPETIPFECCRGSNKYMDKLKNRGSQMEAGFNDVDTILLYTDGISDQFTKTGKKLNRKGLIRSVNAIRNMGTEKWFDEMKGDTDQIDDATMILFQIPE
jgi:serine phosphatase RsbU (regulator of sigma subunit)